MDIWREREIAAANRLEALVPAIKEMVIQLRDGTEKQPYSAVYWLRREISRVVATLGAGTPNTATVEYKYQQQMVGGQRGR